jgi:hypothetical protein
VINFKEDAELPKVAKAYSLSLAESTAFKKYLDKKVAYRTKQSRQSDIAAPCFLQKRVMVPCD